MFNNSWLNKRQQKELLGIARTAVENYIRMERLTDININNKRLSAEEGAFVTLYNSGKLRGCIGRIMSSDQPLWQVVRDMAIAAATEDNRFKPVRAEELDRLRYEISVLSDPVKINDWRDIKLGLHGVIVKQGLKSGVFLPQVAEETGWSREEFLSQLCSQKAGLPPDCYKDKGVQLSVFTTQAFSE